MPATRETQRSNGMKNIIFNSDKTIWDTGGQQINRRRWTGASVATTKTGTGGRDSGVKETCAPVAWGSGGEAWTLVARTMDAVARTMDAGGMENGGKRYSWEWIGLNPNPIGFWPLDSSGFGSYWIWTSINLD